MGIQIGFRQNDVQHLVTETHSERYACGQCEACENMEDCNNFTVGTDVKLEWNGVSIWVHAYHSEHYDQGMCWCDANHWGSNRKPLLYILEGNNIEYYEG
jgi:hypothetical protein